MQTLPKQYKLESLNRLGLMIGEDAKLPLAVVGSEDRGFVSVANARKALHEEDYEYERVDGQKIYVSFRNLTVEY